VQNADPVFKTLQNSAITFSTDLVQGLLDGKNLMESLRSAASALGKQLLSSGISNIIKNPTDIVGYVEAAAGALAELFGNADAKKQQQQIQQAIDQFNELKDSMKDVIATLEGKALGSLASSLTDDSAGADRPPRALPPTAANSNEKDSKQHDGHQRTRAA
jgi:hypothetical protein